MSITEHEETDSLPKPHESAIPEAPNSDLITAPATNSTAIPVTGSAIAVLVAKPKFRHEFYQKPEEVVVTIFAKGIPVNSVAVDYGEEILSLRIDIPGEEPYCFRSRLFGKIIPAKCRYDVLSTKIEFHLAKAEVIPWTSLEFTEEKSIVSASVRKPSYPSYKQIDWDKLETEVKKEEKNEKLEGDAALNKMLQDIYTVSDEDTQRAMKKSFVESNGTVLSSNWTDVSTRKVQETVPHFLEMKKWEY